MSNTPVLILSKQIRTIRTKDERIDYVKVSLYSFIEDSVKYYTIIFDIPINTSEPELCGEIMGGYFKTLETAEYQYDTIVDGIDPYVIIPSLFSAGIDEMSDEDC